MNFNFGRKVGFFIVYVSHWKCVMQEGTLRQGFQLVSIVEQSRERLEKYISVFLACLKLARGR